MRRWLLILSLAGCLALTLLCGVGIAYARQRQGSDLVPAGATDVVFESRGAARAHLSFRLPPGQTFHSLRRMLLRQGWRQARAPNGEPATMTLVRVGAFETVRDIVSISARPGDRKVIDVYLARCLRVAGRSLCP